MYQTMNTSIYDYEMDRYRDRNDFKKFYTDLGLDGIELQLIHTQPLPDKIPAEDVIGVHTNMFPYWLDLYNGNIDKLLSEFKAWPNADKYYGGTEAGIPLNNADTAQADGHAIIYKRIRGELDRAEALGAKYVVFHAGENNLTELWTGIEKNRDAAIIDAVCEIVNNLLEGRDYHFDFLLENLWTGGFTFTDPKMTARLLAGIHYPQKGIMLDTGHLMHTNWDLQRENEAVDYIHRMLDEHGSLCGYIKGVHLQQSLTGDYFKKTFGPAPAVTGDFWDWHNDAMYHVYAQDNHQPWHTPRIRSLIRRIHPNYLTHEVMAWDRKALQNALAVQKKALGNI